MRLRYRLLNVFARPGDPFSGNALCVFEDGSGLDDDQMQALARQFNLSETTFIVRPDDGADAGVRIFTATFEMPFAGHPTLGTAHVARSLGLGGDELSLSMPAGVVPVASQGDSWTLTARPGTVEADLAPAELAPGLGLEPGDLPGPVQQVSVGTSQVIAHARDADVVRRARVVPSAMPSYAAMGRSGGEVLVYLWAPSGDGTIEARALITDGTGVWEDAATGSACSNLGVALHAAGESGQWRISQGEAMHRPSTLELTVDTDGTVRVGGLVRDLGAGELEL
jgi:PhzF family phenazine biosynthesis protein